MAKTTFKMIPHLLIPIHLFLLLTAPAAAAGGPVQIITGPGQPSIPSSIPEFANDDAFAAAILNSTNFYRTAHDACPVTWNDTLAAYATSYLTNVSSNAEGEGKCRFAHSGGPYGENIALGYRDATAAIDAWGDEDAKYDYRHPDFGEDTGHFTQLVWKNTTAVGCGRRLCGAQGWFLVCEYWPRGNVVGSFRTEVGRPIQTRKRSAAAAAAATTTVDGRVRWFGLVGMMGSAALLLW
ncbi:SCP-like extracellular protein [Xylaria sp. CBS 124048]|nr:SCP-like extracellular protein [Xylaria sp. CBS 124048]